MTFQPGQSGNPNGRPKGIIDKRVNLRELLHPHAKDIIEKIVTLAKLGDRTALRLCIERLVPRIKQDDSIKFELPEGRLDDAENKLQIANDLTQAVASGEMTIEEAIKFTNFISHQRRLIKDAEEQKKEELEREEKRKYWEAYYKEQAASEES